MNFKIIVNNPLEAAYLDFLISMGTLNSSPEMVSERFPELKGETKFNVIYVLADKQNKIYGAREIESGKLVSDITNPKKKYWDKKGSAKKAVEDYNLKYANRKLPYSVNRGEHSNLEMIEFILIENKEAD